MDNTEPAIRHLLNLLVLLTDHCTLDKSSIAKYHKEIEAAAWLLDLKELPFALTVSIPRYPTVVKLTPNLDVVYGDTIHNVKPESVLNTSEDRESEVLDKLEEIVETTPNFKMVFEK